MGFGVLWCVPVIYGEAGEVSSVGFWCVALGQSFVAVRQVWSVSLWWLGCVLVRFGEVRSGRRG